MPPTQLDLGHVEEPEVEAVGRFFRPLDELKGGMITESLSAR